MLTITKSSLINGINAEIVNVETDINNGLPGTEMVGLLSNEVKESRERVKIAIKNCGFEFPGKKISINISPADIRKNGTQFDLAIAVGILMGSGILHPDNIDEICFLGELTFNGSVTDVKGVLASVIAAKKQGIKVIIIPYDNYHEASLINDIEIIPVKNLYEACRYLNDGVKPEFSVRMSPVSKYDDRLDFADVRGQYLAKRAAMICAAGKHNLLLSGPPGSGKTMIARRIPTIMPEPEYEEMLELTSIYSIAGKLRGNSMITSRPFRDPHNTVTKAGLIGGGVRPKPGEISFANHGILFMDEFPEFKREVIETLRQPLEEQRIVINRVSDTLVYPADFTLVAAMNRCPCGYYPDRNRCTCNEVDIHRYLSRISQPILDRIDLKVDLPPVSYDDLNSSAKGRFKEENSESIRKKVKAAIELQKKRYAGLGIMYNSRLTGKQAEEICRIPVESNRKLRSFFEKNEFSARSYFRILKTSRTIADLEGCREIEPRHVNEALLFKISGDLDR